MLLQQQLLHKEADVATIFQALSLALSLELKEALSGPQFLHLSFQLSHSWSG